MLLLFLLYILRSLLHNLEPRNALCSAILIGVEVGAGSRHVVSHHFLLFVILVKTHLASQHRLELPLRHPHGLIHARSRSVESFLLLLESVVLRELPEVPLRAGHIRVVVVGRRSVRLSVFLVLLTDLVKLGGGVLELCILLGVLSGSWLPRLLRLQMVLRCDV